MRVEHFGGADEVSSRDALDRALGKRAGKDANEFWISDEPRHPVLAVLVQGGLAFLTYFPDEGHPGFIPRGEDLQLPPGHTTTFYSGRATQSIEIQNENVVSLASALRAAREFFEGRKLPSCIEWDEL